MENIIRDIERKEEKEKAKFERFISNCLDAESVNEARKVENIEIYSNIFKMFIMKLIIEKQLKFDEVVDKLPDAEMIKKDENTLRFINYIFGTDDTTPKSYEVIRSLILTGKTDEFNEVLHYATMDDPIKATFQVSELVNTTPYVKKRRF